MASLRFLLSQNARIASSLSHCEIEYPASGSFWSRSSHCPFSPFTSPRISNACLKAASKASHWPGRILPQNDPHLHRDIPYWYVAREVASDLPDSTQINLLV